MISRLITRSVFYISAAALVLTGMQAYGAIATIDAANIQDNTVAEGDFPDNSSGACDSIFAGNTDNSFARRALMRFDVGAQIPPGSIINSVTLTLDITRGGNNADSTMELHPINAAWVEGAEGCGTRGGGQGEPSTGGVTWNTQPGIGASSGSAAVSGSNPVVWNSNAAMVADVQERRVLGLVLAHQQLRRLGGNAPKYLILGINDVPRTFDRLRGRKMGTHRQTISVRD